MAELPWYVFSPNPISIIQYAILSWIVARQLLKIRSYQKLKHSWVFSFIDGFFITCMFVVLGDAIWAGFCTLKWAPMFPQDLDQIFFSFLRDAVAVVFFFLFIPLKMVEFNAEVKTGIFIMFVSQAIWFLLAPSPAFTDYAFAWRHGYSAAHIVSMFLLSHLIMRIPLWFTIHNSVKIDDSSIRLKKDEQHNKIVLEEV